MKKKILLFSFVSAGTLFGQTFSDNFDNYIVGQYLASQSGGAWTTWSNTPGTAEDVLVSSADAVSGANSIYFETSAMAGGPVDLVKEFGVINTGKFSMSFNIKVETGKAGYFNLQKNAVVGQVWAMDCFFTDNGSIVISNQTGLNFGGTYVQNVWFNFRIDIDFDNNIWEVFTDNVSIGTFTNAENQIASIDVYPTDQNTPFSCGYFIDDFQYTIISTVDLNENNALLSDFEIFPNPTNNNSEIKFNMTQSANVELNVLDINGKTLKSNNYEQLSGSTSIVLNTSDFESGIYFVQMIADGNVIQKRLIVE